MRYLLYFLVSGMSLAGVFFLLARENISEVKPLTTATNLTLPAIPEAEKPAKMPPPTVSKRLADLPEQKPLTNPPPVIKAIYATSWSAGSTPKMDYLIDLIKKTELNAIVIDVKDFSGFVTYGIKNPEVEKYGAKEVRIPRINALIKRLHDENIYVIARITVFQDPVLAKSRTDLAIKDKATNEIWKDRKGLSWVDPASQEVWDYITSIAKDASERGFDELNFDYIRFPSDGDLETLEYPYYKEETSTKAAIIKDFFGYLRSNLQGVKISADLFGLATIVTHDLGIGQVIQDAYENFDYVSPMVYPSHYSYGSLGYKNPANHPYEVVKYSMEQALQKLNALSSKPPTRLRPWLQDFDLGVDYDAIKVREEIKAVYDSGLEYGWMLWDPNNIYTKDALLP